MRLVSIGKHYSLNAHRPDVFDYSFTGKDEYRWEVSYLIRSPEEREREGSTLLSVLAMKTLHMRILRACQVGLAPPNGTGSGTV